MHQLFKVPHERYEDFNFKRELRGWSESNECRKVLDCRTWVTLKFHFQAFDQYINGNTKMHLLCYFHTPLFIFFPFPIEVEGLGLVPVSLQWLYPATVKSPITILASIWDSFLFFYIENEGFCKDSSPYFMTIIPSVEPHPNKDLFLFRSNRASLCQRSTNYIKTK